MGITVGHPKSITIADGTNSNIVLPSDWNSAHAVTLSLANNEVIKYLQAGTNSVSSGTVSFADSNGISFGMGTNGVITGTVKTDYQSAGAYLTTAQPVGAYLTTAALSGHSHAFATTTTNGASIVVGTSNSNGVTIGVPAYLTTTAAQSVQPVAYAAGGTTNNFSTLAFGNSNGLSWSTGTQGVFPSVAVLTTAMLSAAGSNFYNTSNATLANSTHSHGNPTLNLTGINGTTASASNGFTLSLSNIAGTDSYYATGANTIAGTNTSGTNANDQYVFSGAGGVSIGVSSNTIIFSGGAGTINQTGPNIAAPGVTVTNGTVVFQTSPTVTFGMVGSVMTASVAGGGAGTMGGWEPIQANNNTTFSSLGQNSLYLQKVVPMENISFNYIELKASGSTASSAVSANAPYTILYGLYSLNTANNSYGSIATSQMYINASYSSNASMGLTVSQGAASYTDSSAGTVIGSQLSGYKHMYLPFTNTLSAGINYAFGLLISSTTAGNTGPLRLAFLNQSVINNVVIGKIYASTVLGSNSTYVGDYAQGVYNTTTGSMPASVAKSQLTNAISQMRLYLQFEV